jgi:hypothetical protein
MNSKLKQITENVPAKTKFVFEHRVVPDQAMLSRNVNIDTCSQEPPVVVLLFANKESNCSTRRSEIITTFHKSKPLTILSFVPIGNLTDVCSYNPQPGRASQHQWHAQSSQGYPLLFSVLRFFTKFGSLMIYLSGRTVLLFLRCDRILAQFPA